MSDAKKYENVPYRTVSGQTLTMDIYLPENTLYPLPCAVFLFGGGFRQGSKKDISFFPLLFDPLLAAGFCIAAPDYRLVQDGGRFPAPIEDTLAALAFLDKTDIVTVDRNRKAVFGLSSGGYLACMSFLYPEAQSPVRTVLGMSVPTYFKGDGAYADIDRPDLLKDIADGFSGGDERLNLCTLVSRPVFKPSVLLVHGEKDTVVPVGFARRFYTDLQKNGIDAHYVEVGNATHFLKSATHDSTYPSGAALYKTMSDFIITNT